MKLLLILTCSLLMFAGMAKATPPAKEIYYMANNTKIVNTQYGANYTELTLSYDVECFAQRVDTVEKIVILENNTNNQVSFKIALGVLLAGNPMKPCLHHLPEVTTEEAVVRLNPKEMEGIFAGFETIQVYHQCRGHHHCPRPTSTPTPEPTETATPQPTSTSVPHPTHTPMPPCHGHHCPRPTHTATPQPTSTSVPHPTNTPVPPCHGHHCPQPTSTGTPVPMRF